MIIDCHAHLEPRVLDVERMLAKMDAAGIDRVALLPTMMDPLPHTPERLLAVMRRVMAHRATRPLAEVTHRLTLTRSGDLRLGRDVYRIYRQPDNDTVVRVVAEHPQRFLGWMFLNPGADRAVLETLERYRAAPGMIGVKLHPHWHDYRTEILGPLLRRLQELKLPVMFHFGFRARGGFRELCRAFPRLVVIAAHAGFPFFGDLWRYRDECPNLHVDLSSPYLDEELARRAVAAMGPARCLYGTDAPYGFHEPDGSYDYGAIRGWIDRMPVTGAERDAILGGTFASLIAIA